jgi:hypothetical protein
VVVRKIRRYIKGIEIRMPSKPLLLAGLIGTLLFGFMSLAQAQTPLQNVAPGTVITFSGKQWIVLEHKANGETLILLKGFLTSQRAFDEDRTNRFDPTDSNNIAYYLNNSYYNSLGQKNLISEHTWDLGHHGSLACKVGLLSVDEYISYSTVYSGSVLPYNHSDRQWWLITPYSQSSPTEDFIYIVDDWTEGHWSSSNADYSYTYVRPAIYLQSGLVLGQDNTVEEGTTPPQVPAGLSAVATSPTSVDLNWQANTETDLAGYKIFRNGVEIATVGKVTSWTDSGVSPGTTYTYELVAYNTSGQDSGRSNQATVTTPSGGGGDSMLHDKAPGTIIRFSGQEWIILEQMENGETYLILKEPDCQRAFDPDQIGLFAPNDSNNIAYYLNNTFHNSLSQKEFISEHSWDRVSYDLYGNVGTDHGSVNCKVGLISYTEYKEYSTYYDGNVLPSSYSYWWWTRSPRTEYSYTAWEVDATGNLGDTNTANASGSVRPTIYLQAGLSLDENGNVVDGTPGIPPAAPIGLSAVATSPTSVNLTWQANTEQDLAGYKIYRNGVVIETVGKLSSWTDNTASPGTTYTYELVAYNTSGQDSQRSNPATVTTPNLPTPTQLGVVWKGNYVEVSWEAGDTQLGSQAVLWRQMDNGPWTPIKTLTNAEKTGFTYNDRNVGVGLNCRYEIRECGIDNYYRWTVAAESGWATGDRPIKAPAGLRIASVDDNAAVITWNPIISVSSYMVQYSVNGQDWQAGTASGTSANVPRPSRVRVKAEGSYSHWSGVLTVR